MYSRVAEALGEGEALKVLVEREEMGSQHSLPLSSLLLLHMETMQSFPSILELLHILLVMAFFVRPAAQRHGHCAAATTRTKRRVTRRNVEVCIVVEIAVIGSFRGDRISEIAVARSTL